MKPDADINKKIVGVCSLNHKDKTREIQLVYGKVFV